MANIANVRRFNGTSDWIEIDAADWIGNSLDALSMAAIIKNNTDPAESNYRDIVTITGGSGGQWGWILGHQVADDPGWAWYIEGGDGYEVPNVFEAADGWGLIGWSKPAGTNQTVRTHRNFYASPGWIHADVAAGTVDNPDTPAGAAQMRFGTWNESIEFLASDLAVVAIFESNLSDGNFEGMFDDLASWQALSPSGLWLFDQADVSDPVLDLAGNGDEIDRSGTTVVAPTGLTFDVGGDDTGLAWIRA